MREMWCKGTRKGCSLIAWLWNCRQTAMKVKLIRAKDHWHAECSSVIHIESSLPFFYSFKAGRVHRIRSGMFHLLHGVITHTSFDLWCGQHGLISPKHRGLVTDDPPHDIPVCATCEGRAHGAGQLESRVLAGRFVVFTPRL